MRITITIDCDGDAFQPNPAPEIAHVLRRLSGDIADGDADIVLSHMAWERGLFDINGNRCGVMRRGR